MTSAPFRAEVVGSLLRPRRLREAREEHAPGRLGAADFKRVDDAEVDRAIASLDLRTLHLAAFHPTGTAAAGSDAARHPTGPDGRLRGVEGVWVGDASIIPSCPTVNPQLSIMSLAIGAGRNAATA